MKNSAHLRVRVEIPCRDEKHAEDVYDAFKVLLSQLGRGTATLTIYSEMRRPPDPDSIHHCVRYGNGWDRRGMLD